MREYNQSYRLLNREERLEYSRAYRLANLERAREYDRNRKEHKRRARREKMIEFLWKLKEKPCADCHISYHPSAMDFDHVHGIKLFNIGSSINLSEDKLLNEIAKCDLVCANCHRKRGYMRGLYLSGIPN